MPEKKKAAGRPSPDTSIVSTAAPNPRRPSSQKAPSSPSFPGAIAVPGPNGAKEGNSEYSITGTKQASAAPDQTITAVAQVVSGVNVSESELQRLRNFEAACVRAPIAEVVPKPSTLGPEPIEDPNVSRDEESSNHDTKQDTSRASTPSWFKCSRRKWALLVIIATVTAIVLGVVLTRPKSFDLSRYSYDGTWFCSFVHEICRCFFHASLSHFFFTTKLHLLISRRRDLREPFQVLSVCIQA